MYTLVCLDGKVFKYNSQTGETWLYIGQPLGDGKWVKID